MMCECGSKELIWDYKKGAVICSVCGLVVDSIFSSELVYSAEAEKTVDYTNTKSIDKLDNKYRTYVKKKEKSYRIYAKIAHRIAKRSHLFVDHRAFLTLLREGETKGLRLICSTRNSRAETLVRTDPSLRGFLEGIVSRHPLLASRTLRGKVAAAIALRAMSNGKGIDPKTLSELAGISSSQARRIISLVNRLVRSGAISQAVIETVV